MKLGHTVGLLHRSDDCLTRYGGGGGATITFYAQHNRNEINDRY